MSVAAYPLAVARLTAHKVGSRWYYHADETGTWVEVSAESMAELEKMLKEGVPDAYSHWCAMGLDREISAKRAKALGLTW